MKAEKKEIEEQLQSAERYMLEEVIPSLETALQEKTELQRRLAEAEAETKYEELSSLIVDQEEQYHHHIPHQMMLSPIAEEEDQENQQDQEEVQQEEGEHPFVNSRRRGRKSKKKIQSDDTVDATTTRATSSDDYLQNFREAVSSTVEWVSTQFKSKEEEDETMD